MPLIIGSAAVAFIFLALLTLLTLYFILTKWHDFAQGLPLVGGYLARSADYLRDRNAEIIKQVYNAAQSILNWSVDRVNDGFKILHDAYNAAILSSLSNVINTLNSLNGLVRNSLAPALASTIKTLTDLKGLVHGFVILNINAINFWRTTFIHQLDTFIIPSINSLIERVNFITGFTLPTIQARLGVAERTINQTLPAEIAQNRTDTEAVRRVLQQTTTAPGTGLLDRAKVLEQGLAQVLPWALSIGLSIPIARNLARVGRNPCTCLEEDGQTDLMPLVMYLFEEAG